MKINVTHIINHFTSKVAACLALLLLLIGNSVLVPMTVSAQTASPYSGIKHVFVIMMENHDWSAITPAAAPYMNNTLLPQGSFAANYHNIPTALGSSHPSEPNYIWIEAATNAFTDITFTTDANSSSSNSTTSTAHLSTLLTAKGLSWRSYQENMPANTCPINSSGNYAAKHNPFVFFQDVSGSTPSTSNANCISHHEVLTAANLQNDLNSGNVANYNFLTPNLCNDMHDCSVQTGDTWLSQMVPIILNSAVFKQDGALFITWDEGGGGNNPIGMIMLSPKAKANYRSSVEYSHVSYVKTIENIFGLSPYIGHAADSSIKDLGEFFTASAQTPVPSPSLAPSPTPTIKPSPSPTPSPSPSLLPSPTPTKSPSPIPSPLPSPTPSCQISPTYGTVSSSVTVPATSSYKIWSRIMASDAASANYYLEVDTACPTLVSNPTIPFNTWTWVSSTVTLSQGTHTLSLIGTSGNTKLDRIIVTDGTCTPTGTGDNCVTASTSSPTPTPSPSLLPTPTPNACDTADINQDNTVNLLDYSLLASNFLKATITVPRADINHDGLVDLRDYSLLVGQFLKTCH